MVWQWHPTVKSKMGVLFHEAFVNGTPGPRDTPAHGSLNPIAGTLPYHLLSDSKADTFSVTLGAFAEMQGACLRVRRAGFWNPPAPSWSGQVPAHSGPPRAAPLERGERNSTCSTSSLGRCQEMMQGEHRAHGCTEQAPVGCSYCSGEQRAARGWGMVVSELFKDGVLG